MTISDHPPRTRISWTEVVATKRSARDTKIAEFQKEPKNRDHITRITDVAEVQHLQKFIEDGNFSAEEIVRAYIARYVSNLQRFKHA
jgi:hypothetical protein